MTTRYNTVADGRKRHNIGPDPMAAADLKTFFDFYRKHPSRRLAGFFGDIGRRDTNTELLSRALRANTTTNCLVIGCAHWANPRDLGRFLSKIQPATQARITALDVLPHALVEAVRRGVDFIPLLTPAQATPFVSSFFDILVADGLLNCCHFEQHEPIVREMARIAKPHALVLLGLAHAPENRVVRAPERAMPAYCRPLGDFQQMFRRAGFDFPEGSSVETTFGKESDVRIENCIATKRAGRRPSRVSNNGGDA